MKIKLDENIPAHVGQGLAELGHDVDTVKNEGLAGREDVVVWEAAQRENRFFITQDMDFSDIVKFRPGSHAGILLIRLWMPGRTAITTHIINIFKAEPVDKWVKCFVILSDSKLRIIRPRKKTDVV